MPNLVKTGLLMAALTVFFLVAGQLLAGLSGMFIAFLLALAMNFAAYRYSDKMALVMSRAQEVCEEEAPDLHHMITFLASRAEMPKPKLYMMHDRTPNAFATGRDAEHAAVAVTSGLVQLLDRDELEGVLAHELAHIKNGDILISSIAAVLAGD